jgi:hypothetical protein
MAEIDWVGSEINVSVTSQSKLSRLSLGQRKVYRFMNEHLKPTSDRHPPLHVHSARRNSRISTLASTAAERIDILRLFCPYPICFMTKSMLLTYEKALKH